MKKILTVFGTRPEAIKMCPLIIELKKNENVDCKICLTGQHREMLIPIMKCFDLEADYNLDIMKEGQSLTGITTSILEGLDAVLAEVNPDLVLVHGDTSTSFAAALAAFYKQIPVGHVEAGLRTNNIYSPYPEEMNRQLTGRIATYHFAPTENNKKNLLNEGIKDNIYVTGNTVIDAFKTTVREDYRFENDDLRLIFESNMSEVDCSSENSGIDSSEAVRGCGANRSGSEDINKKYILVTAHRRENLGTPLENICNAIKRIVEADENVEVIYPMHMNPKVRDCVKGILDNCERIHLTEPFNVLDMHNLMSKCFLVLTDSGGLQEEAPALGKPVLVMRTETERPEAIEAGTAKLIGVEEDNIFLTTMELINDEEAYQKMAKAVNPYGDGHASERIVDILVS